MRKTQIFEKIPPGEKLGTLLPRVVHVESSLAFESSPFQ